MGIFSGLEVREEASNSEGLVLKQAQGASKAGGCHKRPGPAASEIRGEGTTFSDWGSGPQ